MPLVVPADVAVRPRRSAFAAAFLSFLFPGLGHAYLGRWLRAILWAALPIFLIVAAVGRVVSGSRTDLIEQIADPAFLQAVLLFFLFDVVYRLAAMLDAYRLAVDRSVGSAGTRALSLAGLGALVVVLVGSHVALAQPVMFANDVYAQIAKSGEGDSSEVLTGEELVSQGGKQFELVGEKTDDPTADPGAARTPGPTQAADEPTPEATEAGPTPTPGVAASPPSSWRPGGTASGAARRRRRWGSAARTPWS